MIITIIFDISIGTACMSTPCRNGGTCSDQPLNCYVCTCPAGFMGLNCQTSIYDSSPTTITVDYYSATSGSSPHLIISGRRRMRGRMRRMMRRRISKCSARLRPVEDFFSICSARLRPVEDFFDMFGPLQNSEDLFDMFGPLQNNEDLGSVLIAGNTIQ